ncbi:MAG: imidazole glycerol phosphate synthase subunit HisH [Spirochaetes bacterium]|nr:imidazole glycerol phosphate synthase subunit HisH [Spirochaetota bacterium]
MIGVIDSNICNIFSLTNMLKKLNASYQVIQKGDSFKPFAKLLLPGVGAYPKAMANLAEYQMINPIIEHANQGKPLLGICLGMQLLFESSTEFGKTPGLGLIPGNNIKIQTSFVLPHMGWNNLHITQQNALTQGLKEDADVYFVHSYRVQTDDQYINAVADYGDQIPALVSKQNIYGTQFHPEKSKKWGEVILKNFIDLKS